MNEHERLALSRDVVRERDVIDPNVRHRRLPSSTRLDTVHGTRDDRRERPIVGRALTDRRKDSVRLSSTRAAAAKYFLETGAFRTDVAAMAWVLPNGTVVRFGIADVDAGTETLHGVFTMLSILLNRAETGCVLPKARSDRTDTCSRRSPVCDAVPAWVPLSSSLCLAPARGRP
jgi:hypothetical protein